MAKLGFVLVLLTVQNVIANDDYHYSCDLCIRKPGRWCLSNKVGEQCIFGQEDDACPGANYESMVVTPDFSKPGDLLNPMYTKTTLLLHDTRAQELNLTYVSDTRRTVTTHFRNKLIDTNNDPKIRISVIQHGCNGTACTVGIKATPAYEFCSHYKDVEIQVRFDGFTDEATINYHVPCSCNCTKYMEINSPKCAGHGNYSCGICSCDSDWTGNNCERSCSRGDVSDACDNYNSHGDLLSCSGNGKCDCGNCKCYDDHEGSQYYDPDEKCSDICMQTIECSACLRNGTLGDCRCPTSSQYENMKTIKMIYRNETEAATSTVVFKGKTRKVWVQCMEVADECDFNYYAMKDEEGIYSIMMNSNCNNFTGGMVTTAGSGTNVPLILGILILVAAIAAVGGFLLYKHMNALPPLPMSDPQYANIDAEDCRGENPLYKPPTSSFKNPTYGKW